MRRFSLLHFTRRACRAAAVAVLTIYLASRVNPPDPTAPPTTPTETILADVSIDNEDFAATIDSIRRASRTRVVVPNLRALELDGLVSTKSRPGPDVPATPQRLRDVPLRAALGLALRHQLVDARTDHGTIAIVPADQPPGPAVRRVYDVRDLAADHWAWCELCGFRDGPGSEQGAPDLDSWFQDVLRQVFNEESALYRARLGAAVGPTDTSAGTARPWAGWMIIDAPAATHYRVERLLAALRATGLLTRQGAPR